MNWREFRKLTHEIPDESEVYLELDGKLLEINEQETRCNFTNDNTIILNHKTVTEPEIPLSERWAGTLF